MVPLSDHEQKLLEQMEQALYAEDPKFASVLQGNDLRVRYRRRMALAVLGFILGICLLMGGLYGKTPVVSIVGFIAMLVSVLAGISAYRRTPARDDEAAARTTSPSNVSPLRPVPSRRGLMARIEERWQRRRDDEGH